MFYAATLGMLKWDSLVEYVAIFSCNILFKITKNTLAMQVKWDISIVSYLAEWHILKCTDFSFQLVCVAEHLTL